MDVTIAEIFGIIFGIFLLLLSTVLLIGPDRLRGIFLLSTPDLRVYDPTLNKIVNPSTPSTNPTISTPPRTPSTIPTPITPTPPSMPTSSMPIPSMPTPPNPNPIPTPAAVPVATPIPTNPQGYLQPNQPYQYPSYPTYQGQGPYILPSK